MKKIHKQVPEELYEQILENMPILCVDIIVLHKGKVLLIQRGEEPKKNSWWLVGGRVYKNESFEEAVKRKVLEEIGLKVEVVRKIGLYDYRFNKSRFPNLKTGLHTPTLVYIVEPIEEVNIKLDGTSINYRWITHIEDGLPNFVRRILNDSGVFK